MSEEEQPREPLPGEPGFVERRHYERDRRGILPASLMLPICHDSKRATPNTFIRSALFAAVQSRKRPYLKQQVLFSQNGFAIRFTGQQLNQEDLSVWQALTHQIRDHPLGTNVQFSPFHLLKSMGLGTGGNQLAVLDATIDRLQACNVTIIVPSGTCYGAGPLIERSKHDDHGSYYFVRLNPDLIKIFGKSEWTAVDWEQRKLLRKMPLAQFLHAHYSTHETPYDYKVETLYKLSGSANQRISGFKQQLVKALNELRDIEFLNDYCIDSNNMVHVELR